MSLSNRFSGASPLRSFWCSVGGMLLRGLLFGVLPLVGLAAALAQLDLSESEDTKLIAAAQFQTARCSGHAVREICVSNDSLTAWITRIPSIVQQIDLRTGAVLATSSVSSRYVSDIQLTSPKRGAAVFEDERGTVVRALQSPGAEEVIHTNLHGNLHDNIRIAVNPIRDLIAFGCGKTIEVRTTDGSAAGRSVSLDCAMSDLRWSNDGALLLTLLMDGRMQIYDAEALSLRQSLLTPIIGSARILWSQSGTHATIFSTTGEFAIWNLVQNTMTTLKMQEGTVRIAALSPDGQWIACPDSEDQVWLLSTSGTQERRFLGSSPLLINALSFTADGQSLLVGGMNGRLERWSLADGAVEWSTDAAVELPEVMPAPSQPRAIAPLARSAEPASPPVVPTNGMTMRPHIDHRDAARAITRS